MEIPHLPQERKRVVVGTLVLLLLLLIIGILVAVSSGKGRFSSCECIFKDFLGNWNFKTFFEIGMRYGEPSLSEALKKMKENNVSKIIVLPLYPQSGSPTTSTTYDEISNILKNWTWVPDLVFVSGYHDNQDYINALAKTIKRLPS